jgi:hypothetical protein
MPAKQRAHGELGHSKPINPGSPTTGAMHHFVHPPFDRLPGRWSRASSE